MRGALRLADVFGEADGLLDAYRRAGLRIAVAESCTGGLMCAALTAFAGSSDVVVGGVVSYADSLKESLLGVSADVLRRHGAVSAEVAKAMAGGVRARCGADVGVGITGVAGPGGGTRDKPAGLIFVAVDSGDWADVVRLERDAGREENRAAAVRAGVTLCSRVPGLRAGAG